MTASDPTRPSTASGKMKRLVIGIVIFLIVYTGAWFLAAHQIETRLSSFLAAREARGSIADCTGMDVRGYPFRIGLFCDTVKLDDTRMGASASFGALRSAAQVYAPGHAVFELDGPAEIRVSPGVAVSADWSLLHASLQAHFSGLSRTSITYDDLTGTMRAQAADENLRFTASHGEAHLRQNGADLDVAMSIDDLDLAPVAGGPSLLPLLKSAMDLTLTDRAGLLDAGGFSRLALRNSKGEMRNLTLDIGNGMVTKASGPFTINDQGLVSGEFSVTMENIEGWRQNLTTSFPDEDGVALINNIANMLTALANGKNEATVKLNVRDGTAFLAFFPIGELPQF